MSTQSDISLLMMDLWSFLLLVSSCRLMPIFKSSNYKRNYKPLMFEYCIFLKFYELEITIGKRPANGDHFVQGKGTLFRNI